MDIGENDDMRMTVAIWIASALFTAALLAQAISPPRINETVIQLAGGIMMPYAIAVPRDLERDDPRPLVLALHPGGRAPYYGSRFMRRMVEPALRQWRAIIVAPDVPTERWANEESEQAVMTLVQDVMTNHAIDRSRVLVTGFSMGGRGTWYLATRQADTFTGAIPIAASRRDDPLDGLGSMPVHIIHSPNDKIIPFGPAKATAEQLRQRGHAIEFIEVTGADHHNMGAYIEPLQRAGAWMIERWDSDSSKEVGNRR